MIKKNVYFKDRSGVMFDEHNEVQQKNIELLLDGYWDGNLPPIIKMQELYQFAKRVIKDIDEDKYSDFEKKNGYITGFKDTTPPSYIYNDGIEPITYFDFKKNGALREMQVPNLKYYCSFVYNSLAAYNDLFGKLYNKREFTISDILAIKKALKLSDEQITEIFLN